ncbi:hypothetical protein BJV74DRAFT_795588 [Russula compacta]|nr:hypothetical protein BJV74DRAFT_795588 [Russula compacta]
MSQAVLKAKRSPAYCHERIYCLTDNIPDAECRLPLPRLNSRLVHHYAIHILIPILGFVSAIQTETDTLMAYWRLAAVPACVEALLGDGHGGVGDGLGLEEQRWTVPVGSCGTNFCVSGDKPS